MFAGELGFENESRYIVVIVSTRNICSMKLTSQYILLKCEVGAHKNYDIDRMCVYARYKKPDGVPPRGMPFRATQPIRLARAPHGTRDGTRRNKLVAKTSPIQKAKIKMSLRLSVKCV